MKPWFKRMRAAIGLGLTWAAGWAPLGALTGGVTAAVLGLPLGVVTVNYAVMFSVLGFVGGTLFASVLRLAEARRSFERLTIPRFAAWGSLGGLVLGGMAVTGGLLGAGATSLGAVIVGASTLLSAGSSAGTLVVARSAHRRALKNGDTLGAAEVTGPAGQPGLGPAE